MANEDINEIDLNIPTENVSFLDICFDNSFVLQCSLNYVKGCATETEETVSYKNKLNYGKKLLSHEKSEIRQSSNELKCDLKLSESIESTRCFQKKLRNWGLPTEITKKYELRNIKEMFDWQIDCLGNPKVLSEGRNLIYSAPTSAGKTLVAEILTIKTILERQKKAILILPFVSIVREKMFYLQDILSSSGIRVEGFMGSQSPPGGMKAVHLAICTIEKANSLINKLIDEDTISELGALIVDELHLLGDPHRGYILELLLTKVKYLTSKFPHIKIQIIGMSATLPNLEVLSNWLDAELFITEFRPIPLDEFCLVGNKFYDKNCTYINKIDCLKEGTSEIDPVLYICLETIKECCSVLIFCMTKSRCENLAQNIASSFYKLGCAKNGYGTVLREQLKSDLILEILEQLQNCPVGLDQVLKNIISFGVAYHHAGLTFDERDIIEGAFKSGAIRVLVATSTLSSGVNLPARKVIIRSPVFQKQPINILTYKQMAGRAGRMGRDTKGESIIICSQAEQTIGFNLINGKLNPVKSCIDNEDKFMRAILELIASQVLCTKAELELYSKCTLLFYQENILISQKSMLDNTLKELINFELVRSQIDTNDNKYSATSLGKACLSSSMAPGDGISLFCELQKARQCLVLETDLHLIYLVTPYSVSSQWHDIDWLHLLTLWESLTVAMKRAGELVGVQESFIIRSMRGPNKTSNCQNKLNIHKRFYTALALQDLVNEVPLSEVAIKFQCARGFLQGLQQAAATFAGMVTAFCRQLGWSNMEMLVSQFQDRLHFGIHSELLELMRLSSLNGLRARTLFDAGFETIACIASANINMIENALCKSVPFQSEKVRECDDDVDLRKRNKMRNIWITGRCGMTAKEAAENLILEAREHLQKEIGVKDIKWAEDKLHDSKSDTDNANVSIPQDNSNINIEQTKYKNQIIQESSDDKSDIIDKVDVQPDIYSALVSKVENESVDFNNITSNKQIQNTVPVNLINENISIQNPAKEDLEWDSLVFSETVLNNISSVRLPTSVSSPNISFGDSISENIVDEAVTSNFSSGKDISLFSSDGNDSSLFEDSLPLDSIPCTLVRNANVINYDNKEIINHEMDINSTSLLNAFKSSMSNIDEDEDIKLVYEEDKFTEDQEEHSMSSLVENNVIVNSQTNELSVSKNFISPLKRLVDKSLPEDNRSGKQRKLQIRVVQSPLKVKLNCPQSEEKILNIREEKIHYNIFRSIDVIDNFNFIENKSDMSLIFDIRSGSKLSSDLIGSNIFSRNDLNNISIGSISTYANSLYGIAFCVDKEVCVYYDMKSIDENALILMKAKLSNYFKTKLLQLTTFCTYDVQLLAKKLLGIDLLPCIHDVSRTEWLLHSGEKLTNCLELMKKYCNTDLLNIQIGIDSQNKTYHELDLIEKCLVQSWSLRIVAEQQRSLLDNYDFMRRTLSTETHVAKILANCEFYGITVDKDLASRLLIDVKSTQEVLQKKAFKLCGHHFNFNSSKDVAKVLGLYKGRKISTRKSVLTAHNSPMANIVMFWRKLNSMLTKTLYPLTEQACIYSEDNRISPSYTMYTCTGRISMHEPNLQNVPRTFSIPLKYLTLNDNSELNDDVIEFNCRNIFKSAPGFIFVSADYCQLEMRILTHYSGDAVLSNIMCSDTDVFKSIAASWSGLPEEEVDDDLRQKAKQLCYGILYGMGNRTLAQHLEVSEIEAAMFMDTFFKTYPGIKVFTQSLVENCRIAGYVETLMKRRRYLPDINSKLAAKRSTAERQAINTTIQGSAADITKSAMCAIDTKSYGDCPRLILHMHDELIYRVPEAQKYYFIRLLKETMEDTVVLNVPLPVKVRAGHTWGSLVEEKLFRKTPPTSDSGDKTVKTNKGS